MKENKKKNNLHEHPYNSQPPPAQRQFFQTPSMTFQFRTKKTASILKDGRRCKDNFTTAARAIKGNASIHDTHKFSH